VNPSFGLKRFFTLNSREMRPEQGAGKRGLLTDVAVRFLRMVES
jgi:hypothetical protein